MMKFLQKFEVLHKVYAFVNKYRNKPGGDLHLDKQDPRDENYTMKGSFWGYTPTKPKVDNFNKILEIKNQSGQNTCVLESTCTGLDVERVNRLMLEVVEDVNGLAKIKDTIKPLDPHQMIRCDFWIKVGTYTSVLKSINFT